jgi:isoleucyl-tRNA synthetase
LIAPITPFISEEMYRNLTGEESVHLADYPVFNEELINNEIEEKMDLVRNLISIGRYVREEAKIKVRQPLSEALIDGKNKEIIGNLIPLIEEELNVKKVEFVDNLGKYMNFLVKPNFKLVGKIFGPNIKEFASLLENLSEEEINKLNNNEPINMIIAGNSYEINKEMVDIRISSKEGFNVGMEDNNFIILNTELTPDLVYEGLAREFVSKVQNIRKTKDYNVVDRINIYVNGDEEFIDSLNNFKGYIEKETLAEAIIKKDELTENYDLNGHNVYIEIEKSSK